MRYAGLIGAGIAELLHLKYLAPASAGDFFAYSEINMNIDELTIGQAKALAAMFAPAAPVTPSIDCKMIGKYVIVRCRDAGVHAGVLESYNGRECVLTESRRMWYWKPADGQKYLSGLAIAGADEASKIGVALPRIFLTENCEIIECSAKAESSIRGAKADEN